MREEIDDVLEATRTDDTSKFRQFINKNPVSDIREAFGILRQRPTPRLMRNLDLQNRAAELSLQGYYDWQIAEELEVSVQRARQLLKYVREAWIAGALVNYDALKARQAAKIDLLERMNWRVISDVHDETTSTETYTDMHHKKIVEAQRMIMWCIDRRNKMFGLDAPVEINWRVEATRYGIDVDKMYHTMIDSFATQLVDEEAVAEIEARIDTIPLAIPEHDEDDFQTEDDEEDVS